MKDGKGLYPSNWNNKIIFIYKFIRFKYFINSYSLTVKTKDFKSFDIGAIPVMSL